MPGLTVSPRAFDDPKIVSFPSARRYDLKATFLNVAPRNQESDLVIVAQAQLGSRKGRVPWFLQGFTLARAFASNRLPSNCQRTVPEGTRASYQNSLEPARPRLHPTAKACGLSAKSVCNPVVVAGGVEAEQLAIRERTADNPGPMEMLQKQRQLGTRRVADGLRHRGRSRVERLRTPRRFEEGFEFTQCLRLREACHVQPRAETNSGVSATVNRPFRRRNGRSTT
jgi:hypothetical protein